MISRILILMIFAASGALIGTGQSPPDRAVLPHQTAEIPDQAAGASRQGARASRRATAWPSGNTGLPPTPPGFSGQDSTLAASPAAGTLGASPERLGSPTSALGAIFSNDSIVPSTNTRPQMATAGDLIGFSHADGSGNLTITLVHTGKSWMSVYHVDSKGAIRLASSRPLDADFSLQLNATDPLPEDIRAMKHRVRPGK